MTHDDIARCDVSNMMKLLVEFPRQAEEAVAIGEAAALPFRAKSIGMLVITGLGGSAIGGDLLRSYASETSRVPLLVSRHYGLPACVDRRTLVIVSSYSGNTEETIAAYADAVKRKAQVLCITSGGTVASLAARRRHSVIRIPGGLPPRAALGYSFFPMLVAAARLGIVKPQKLPIRETIAFLREKSVIYRDPESRTNPALQLAEKLLGKIPLIYSSADRFDAVNLRWQGQMQENAKNLAYGRLFPELNHNEIVGWQMHPDLLKRFHIVLLRDREYHRRVQLRIDITKRIIGLLPDGITEVSSEGKSLLTRIFSLLYLGDWTSFYLALLNGVDPTPVEKISQLKNELAAVR